MNFFSKFSNMGLLIFDICQKCALKSGGRVYWSFLNPNYWSKKPQIQLKMIPQRYSSCSMVSSDHFFFKILQYGSLNFWYRPKMVFRKVAGGYIEASSIQTSGPKSLKYSLKWSQGDTQAAPWFHQTIFLFSKFCDMGLLIFDIGQKWCSQKWRARILKLPKS